MSSTTNTPMSIADQYGLRRFTVDEYHRLGEAGVLSEDDRVELLDGLILTKMIHSPLHDATVSIVESVVRPLLPNDHILRIQSAIQAAGSEPEPDIAVVRGPPERYLSHHPQGADIRLIVEVTDRSLERDRLKALIYAVEEIAEYWIIDLRNQVVELYRDARSGQYQDRHVLNKDETIEFTPPGEATARIAITRLFAP